MSEKSIHFIITGGTIDSYYDGTKDTAVPNEHSVVPKYINILKLYEKTEFSEVCMKDSRKLTEKDRKNVLKEVKKSDSKRIIITHGTYTLPDTARYLKANLKDHGKVIIFVCLVKKAETVNFKPLHTDLVSLRLLFPISFLSVRLMRLIRIFWLTEIVAFCAEGVCVHPAIRMEKTSFSLLAEVPIGKWRLILKST